MAEIKSGNLDSQHEGKPVAGPADTQGGLDDGHEGRPVVGYEFGGSAPSKATMPDPQDDATGVALDKALSWADGGGATSYDVYFGDSSPPASIGSQPGTTYDPGDLDPETEYFWRVDAKNGYGTTTGDEWSFTTQASGGGGRKAAIVIIIT